MTTSAERIRSYSGPAILSYGFRPLFFCAGLWSALAMTIWIVFLSTGRSLPSAFAMVDWHVHELLYGYLPAVVAGFLLTAVPNWTGRLPITGAPLLVLTALWLAGRVILTVSAISGPVIAALVDLSFLAVLALVIGREVVSGRNWRNLKVLIAVGLLFFGNGLFHWEAASQGAAWNAYGARTGIAVAIFLIMLIGGRVVPSFTRNWLARQSRGRLPAPFGRFDMVTIGIAGATLVLWVAAPDRSETAIFCLIAGFLHAARLARWAGERTAAEPLMLILHVGYGFVPLGFLAVGLAGLSPETLPMSCALHAWTVGAVGVMTIAVMTRASLGHAGKPLHATPGIAVVYVCIIAAAVLRVLSGLDSAPESVLHLAAGAWIAAFTGFTIVFAPLLVRARK